MTDERRAELLAKKAELQDALDFVERFEDQRKEVRKIEQKYGYGHDGPRSAIKMKLSDIDKELDYDSYLIGLSVEYVSWPHPNPDIVEICRRYLVDRGVHVEGKE